MNIKSQHLVLVCLLISTAIIIPNFWQIGMTAMVGFFLAYLTKGSRKEKKNKNTRI